MVRRLASLSELIEERNVRLDSLLGVLRGQENDWVSAETVFSHLMKNPNSHYSSDAWSLFTADLEFLEDHDCLVISDDNVSVLENAS